MAENFTISYVRGTDRISNSRYGCDTILHSKNDSDVMFLYANAVFAVLRSTFSFIFDYVFVILVYVSVFVLLWLAYKSFISPISLVKELTEVGFDHIPSGRDRDQRIARAQTTRRLGNKIPPPYPNGWFAVAESRELKIGEVISADVLGQNLCVYRGTDGAARVVDAYCPHLGANLAIGGAVSGNCIECPFHKWAFDDKGICVSVPGQENAPKGVSIRIWHTVEADGAVWIWHDAEQRAPLWPLEDAPECKKWAYRGRNEFTVSAHIQEIPENGADVSHLNAVHATSVMSTIGERFPLLYQLIGEHVWDATWQKNEDHTATVHLKQHYRIMNIRLFHIELIITQNGPGHVRLRLNTTFGPFLFSQSVTPLGPLLQRVVHRVYSPPSNALLSAAIILGESKMIQRDIIIWNNKKFVSAPAYVKADRTIKAFRTWFSQFYSDHSDSGKLLKMTRSENFPYVTSILDLLFLLNNACESREIIDDSFWANSKRGKVLVLLNMWPYEQFIHQEMCVHERKQMYCREGCRWV